MFTIKVSFGAELWRQIQEYAKSKSTYAGMVVKSWMKQYPFGKDVLPVVVDVPQSILGNREELQAFFDKKSQAIVELLSKEEKEVKNDCCADSNNANFVLQQQQLEQLEKSC